MNHKLPATTYLFQVGHEVIAWVLSSYITSQQDLRYRLALGFFSYNLLLYYYYYYYYYYIDSNVISHRGFRINNFRYYTFSQMTESRSIPVNIFQSFWRFRRGPRTRKVTERCRRTPFALLVWPQENRFPNQSTY